MITHQAHRRLHDNTSSPQVFAWYRANARGLDVLSCKRLWAWCVIVQTPVGLMRYHAHACGFDVWSCTRLRAWCVIMQTPAGLMCYHANACGFDVLSCKRLWARCVIMQTPVGLMCFHANACGLDVFSQYQHLGAAFAQGYSLAAELTQRLAKPMLLFRRLANRFYWTSICPNRSDCSFWTLLFFQYYSTELVDGRLFLLVCTRKFIMPSFMATPNPSVRLLVRHSGLWCRSTSPCSLCEIGEASVAPCFATSAACPAAFVWHDNTSSPQAFAW